MTELLKETPPAGWGLKVVCFQIKNFGLYNKQTNKQELNKQTKEATISPQHGVASDVVKVEGEDLATQVP